MQAESEAGRTDNAGTASQAGGGLVITCEHGGNRIPAPYRDLFRPYRASLQSHRGFDAGALQMARALANAFAAPLAAATVSRLLVDLNRSLGHPHLHCAAVRRLPASVRARIVEQHYRPYRLQAERLVTTAIARHGGVVHLSSHSFTPEMDGKVRAADIGLLYDPARPGEVALAARWKAALAAQAPELKVRRNYPYAGKNDGLTTSLRKRFSSERYVGVELELNQGHVLRGGEQWAALRETLIATLRTALDSWGREILEQAPRSGPMRHRDASQFNASSRRDRHTAGAHQ